MLIFDVLIKYYSKVRYIYIRILLSNIVRDNNFILQSPPLFWARQPTVTSFPALVKVNDIV